MKTIFLLHDESGSPEPRLQTVADSRVTQRPSEGTPASNCDLWGHPFPDYVERQGPSATKVIDFSTFQKMR
jgi:hypothetical protein